MNLNTDVEDIQKRVREVFQDDFGKYDHADVVVSENAHAIRVEVSKMYEHIELNFDKLLKLAEIFGTQNFKIKEWSNSGCETCDYGSSYVHTFTYEVGNERKGSPDSEVTTRTN